MLGFYICIITLASSVGGTTPLKFIIYWDEFLILLLIVLAFVIFVILILDIPERNTEKSSDTPIDSYWTWRSSQKKKT